MLDRTRVAIQSYILAEKFNITNEVVHNIINSYIDYCRKSIIRGVRIDFLGLVSIIPDVINDDFKFTMAYMCNEVANSLSLSYNIVFSVMSEYINTAKSQLKDGTTVEIRGLVTMTPLSENGCVTKVHSNISQSLRKMLANSDSNVKSFRVHTYKSLRDEFLNS